jgi:hypothetical protein
MPVSERTFSFRAPEDFGDRVREASLILDDPALLMGAAEKVVSDLQYAREYAKVAAEQTDDEAAFRRAAQTAAGERWRDD